MNGETDLSALLRGLDPALDPRRWAFVALEGPAPAEALMTFVEDEGPCAIVPAPPGAPGFRRIVLRVHSSLEAVGLTAAVSARLAAIGVPANVVAALRHDHVFVPEADAERALAALRALSRAATLDPPAGAP
jgi:hypothetical protein